MADEREQREQPEGYESPQVEDVPAEDGPAVTAASGTADGGAGAAEWRPGPGGEASDTNRPTEG